MLPLTGKEKRNRYEEKNGIEIQRRKEERTKEKRENKTKDQEKVERPNRIPSLIIIFT